MYMPVKTVKVMCVWPAERGPKNDCRGGTNVVWAGHGDVQDYPAHLWHRLADHPDVWKLHDPQADTRIADARAKAEKARADAAAAIAEAERVEREEQQRVANAANQAAEDAERQRKAEEERVALEARAAAEAGKQMGTDVVTVTSVNDKTHPYTAAELEALDGEKIHAIASERGYELNPRLKLENLRIRFLEAQAADTNVLAANADSDGGEA